MKYQRRKRSTSRSGMRPRSPDFSPSRESARFVLFCPLGSAEGPIIHGGDCGVLASAALRHCAISYYMEKGSKRPDTLGDCAKPRAAVWRKPATWCWIAPFIAGGKSLADACIAGKAMRTAGVDGLRTGFSAKSGGKPSTDRAKQSPMSMIPSCSCTAARQPAELKLPRTWGSVSVRRHRCIPSRRPIHSLPCAGCAQDGMTAEN